MPTSPRKSSSLTRIFSILSGGSERDNAEETRTRRDVKKKCLVLHGWRSNAKVSAEHAKHLHLQKKFEKIHLLKGTVRAEEAADDITGGMFLGPWFSWVDDVGGKNAEKDVVRALKHVVRFVRKHGPYSSAVGFSQGGRSRFVVVEDGGFASVGSRGCVFVEERGGNVWREREIDRSGGACVRSTFER